MRKIPILTFLLALFALGAQADSKETVTVNGTVVNKFATSIKFSGDNVILSYGDGSTQTAGLEETNIAFEHVAVFGDASGFQNVETIKTFGDRTMAVEVTRDVTANEWNAICLPFALSASDIATIFGEGTKVAQLESATATNVNFASTTEMSADTPYIIFPTQDVSSFTLDAVTLSHYAEGSTATATPYDFVGTLDAVTPTGSAYTISGISEVSALASGSSVKALQAYLTCSTGDSTPATFTVDGSSVMKGDVNSDGFVNIYDVTLTIDYILGKEVSNFNLEAADIDDDEYINIYDVTKIIDFILKGTWE